jgi:hypothetical protein
MARKRATREDADSSRPRQLRKRLRKAEDQLADAVQKRDRAQARVEALSIIADEIRAQLAEAEKADAEKAEEPAAEASPPVRAPRKKASAGKKASAEQASSESETPDSAG